MMTMMMIFDDNDDDGSHVMLGARYVWRLDCIHLDEIPENHFYHSWTTLKFGGF